MYSNFYGFYEKPFDVTPDSKFLYLNEAYREILIDLGLARSDEALLKVEMFHRLNEFATKLLSRGGNVVLIVDEAQNFDNRTMENLRLLSNLGTRKHKLIQIVLSGQPELEAK